MHVQSAAASISIYFPPLRTLPRHQNLLCSSTLDSAEKARTRAICHLPSAAESLSLSHRALTPPRHPPDPPPPHTPTASATTSPCPPPSPPPRHPLHRDPLLLPPCSIADYGGHRHRCCCRLCRSVWSPPTCPRSPIARSNPPRTPSRRTWPECSSAFARRYHLGWVFPTPVVAVDREAIDERCA